MNAITEPNPTELHATIKLGIDAHAKWFYVARQVDGATPQPVQKMTFDSLLGFKHGSDNISLELNGVFVFIDLRVELLSAPDPALFHVI